VEKQLLNGEDVFVIHPFLSPQECEQYIARSEQIGYEEAPITTSAGMVMNKDVRDNRRVMIDDHALSAELWERARPFLPPRIGRWEALGFNERWRYYRYDPGERFAPHYDGCFERNISERSQLTFMIYLNDGFEGGETHFYRMGGFPWLSVKPEAGKALVFIHRQLHEGAPVLTGRKYVLRSDVMYRRVLES
jgi:predicted 2-oxoglutarate/Fe(II)-dependent dioxygenase YbiX